MKEPAKFLKKIRSYNYYLIEKWECEYEKDCLENESMSEFVQKVKLKMQEPLNLRNAFFGRRTSNAANIYDVQDNQKIKYIDVFSLYLYKCK